MADQHRVTAYVTNGMLLESYWFSKDMEVSLPNHSHDDYQIGLALTDAGEYHYRRAYHPVPVGSISVIHPGEIHSGCGLRKRAKPAEFLSFYISPASIASRLGHLPHVQPITFDAALERGLRSLHKALQEREVSVETENA